MFTFILQVSVEDEEKRSGGGGHILFSLCFSCASGQFIFY